MFFFFGNSGFSSLTSRQRMGSAQDKDAGPTQKDDWALPGCNPCEPCPAGKVAVKNRERRPLGTIFPFDKDTSQGSHLYVNRQNWNSAETRSVSPYVKSGHTNDVRHQINSTNEHENCDWTELDSHQLENAVKVVAMRAGMHVPRFRELNACYQDGKFGTSEDETFWQEVANRVRHHSAESCYFKYKELHGSGVARFAVPKISDTRHGHFGGSEMAAIAPPHHAHTGSRHGRRHHSSVF